MNFTRSENTWKSHNRLIHKKQEKRNLNSYENTVADERKFKIDTLWILVTFVL